MKIIIATTIMENESPNFFLENINKLKKWGYDILSIANTPQKIDVDIQINNIGDMKLSREELLKECHKYEADIYFILDADILFDKDNFFEKVISYKEEYDFISLSYKGDPPIPIFYTIASSLNDFLNYKKNIFSKTESFSFDDSDFNNSTYSSFNTKNNYKDLGNILMGKSFARDIKESDLSQNTNKKYRTTGGATVYFKKEVLLPSFNWEKYKDKSLIWYDSFRTFMLTKDFSFIKVPIFVNHIRNNMTVKLSWDSVISYINGFNLYKSKIDSNWNQEAIITHTKELFFYIKGLIKKIELLKINHDEEKVIIKIKKFIDINIFELLKKECVIWK